MTVKMCAQMPAECADDGSVGVCVDDGENVCADAGRMRAQMTVVWVCAWMTVKMCVQMTVECVRGMRAQMPAECVRR